MWVATLPELADEPKDFKHPDAAIEWACGAIAEWLGGHVDTDDMPVGATESYTIRVRRTSQFEYRVYEKDHGAECIINPKPVNIDPALCIE